MTHPIIIRFIVVILTVNSFYSQSDFGARLLAAEREIFLSRNDTHTNDLILNKIDLYLKYDSVNTDLLREVKRVNTTLLNKDTVKEKFYWNACLIAHLNNDFNNASNYLHSYANQRSDSTLDFLLLAVLVFHEHDTEKVSSLIRQAAKTDSSFYALKCMNSIEMLAHIKAKKILIFCSHLIPGTGTMFVGRPVKGAVSLLLTGTLGAATYFLASRGLYMNAFFISFPWFYKFYWGQTRLTRKMIEEKETHRQAKLAETCEESLRILMDKHTLLFK